MASFKTHNFLPEVFRSDANKKFLNATLDQLVSEPKFKKVSGYIGRTFAPTYKAGDGYIQETTAARQQYQLEPGVVAIDAAADSVDFYASYTDVVNKINYYGGNTQDHSRLFAGEFYSYDGKFDFDKFVNFNNYCWLPNGPEAVVVSATGTPISATWDVNVNAGNGTFYFNDQSLAQGNPELTLAYGGVYKFVVGEGAGPLYIQTAPGTSGQDPRRPNIGTRAVLGVENNGATTGTVTFKVPQTSSQDKFINMPVVAEVDYASTLQYRDIQGSTVGELYTRFQGLDGVTANLAGRSMIFVGRDNIDDLSWTVGSTQIEKSLRKNVWLIQVDADGVISLTPSTAVNKQERVFVKAGTANATKYFYVDYYELYNEVPLITAPLNKLYFQSGALASAVGVINLVAPINQTLDPAADIVGKPAYTSPNGVAFTNGLKVKFDSATVGEYAGQEFYVAGVGTAIRLVPVAELIAPEIWSGTHVDPLAAGVGYSVNDVLTLSASEPDVAAVVKVTGVSATGAITQVEVLSAGKYRDLPTDSVAVTGGRGTGARIVAVLQPSTPDYLTIDRASRDRSAWARHNRWFHIDVVKFAAEFNGNDFMLDQAQVAKRPIIEFTADLKLFNHGVVAKNYISYLDTAVTDAYFQIENAPTASADVLTIAVAGKTITLRNNDRVIFSADTNPDVSSKIYTINIVDVSEDPFTPAYITRIVEATDAVVTDGTAVLAKNNTGVKEFWFNGAAWIAAQTKAAGLQAPLFDAFDTDGRSFGDATVYTNTSFKGTQIFSYTAGTGAADAVLGFPLSYRSFNNVGDIQFTNRFDTDTFTHLVGPVTRTVKINSGFLHQHSAVTDYTVANVWERVANPSRQYQLVSYVYDGNNNLFEVDILPSAITQPPSVKVLVNSRQIAADKFGLTQIGERFAVLVAADLLAANDTVNILIYSSEVSATGFYQVPANLDNNSLNENFLTLTLGQLRNHLVTIGANSADIIGQVPGNNNLRDLPTKTRSGSILKHASPAVYSAAFLVDDQLSFVDAIKLAQREYSKFKNKFLELAANTEINVDDIAGSADKILSQINSVKNSSFPWYYSDMVPYGTNKTVLPAYTVLDTRIKTYELSAIFNDTVLSNRAVLVYLTRETEGKTVTRLLVNGQDYSFSQSYPAITIADTFGLNYNDVLTIVEYSSTDGNYIPETPTKLGLHPKYVPAKYMDDTYLTPTEVIQGHDGSLTPAFGDFRDDLLLELELRIYNNIKVAYQGSVVEYPGKFRTTEYSLQEFNQILNSSFLAWAGANRLDFAVNTAFQSNNPWTWNYKNFKDTVDGEFLTGSWRAVFMWLYDTMRPHTHPWEMLGFTAQPAWWTDRYGPAPYTGGNLTLWTDLSQGFIYAGERAGIDARYARPGLLKLIPVDESGNLLSPEKYAVLDFDSNKANASFAVGDIGPAEAAWRKSSDYAFALQLAAALAKPAQYFSLCANVDAYRKNDALGQYIVTATNQHLTPIDIAVNGANEGAERAAGYVNWVCEYLKNLGLATPQDTIKAFMKNLSVQLNYRVAGFTDKKFLKILAEQGSPTSTNNSIVVPDENYRIFVNKSVPVDRIVYSAVIVEKSANGYTVSGYNLSNPYFTVVPSLVNNNAYSITVNKRTGTVYRDFETRLVDVAYGTEFESSQAVVDFLVSYQRFLQSQGFAFVDNDLDLQTKRDWILSAREFLTWAQQGWAPGNVLVLSPVKDVLRVATFDSQVDEIVNTPNGSKLLDLNFNAIKRSEFTVTRANNEFGVASTNGQVIALAELSLVQYEHVILFDNTTVFNDIIYAPASGNRQFRLKIVGHKTADWSGEMNPPGFMYNSPDVDAWQAGKDYRKGALVTFKDFYYTALENVTANEQFDTAAWQQIDQAQIKTGLLPNFATNAAAFESVYDIDNAPYSEEASFYSTGLIGFRERSYLTDLLVDAETQAKFYQGFIKQKGTRNAIDALASAQINNSNNGISVYEEWAVRVGEYGSTDSNQYVEVILDESAITANPAAIQFVDSADQAQSGAAVVTPADWYQSAKNNTSKMFDQYVSSADRAVMPVAGYVNLDDVDATIYDMADYRTLSNSLSQVEVGYTIWTARDFAGQWNVYRVSETDNSVVSLSYNMDNIATVTTKQVHNIAAGDVVAVKGFSAVVNDSTTSFDGFYQVYSVVDDYNFTIVLVTGYKELRDAKVIYDSAVLLKLVSSKIDTVDQIKTIEPKFGWTPDDYVWVNSATAQGWGVYRRVAPWQYAAESQLNTSEYAGSDRFGSAIVANPTGQFMYVGAPGNRSGRVAGFVKQPDGSWLENVSLTSNNTTTKGFGNAVTLNPRALVVAASQSHNATGQVFLYRERQVIVSQVLTGTDAGDEFGYSACTSKNGDWLYIGAPGANRVYAYTWQDSDIIIQQASQGVLGVTLSSPVKSASDVTILGSTTYVPGVDFTVTNGTDLEFTNTLAEPVIVSLNSGYRFVAEIAAPANVDRFGAAISCTDDGATLVVGAPNSSATQFKSGSAWVFTRSVEQFVASGTRNSFNLSSAVGDYSSVTVNGVTQIADVNFEFVGSSMQLNFTPVAGQIVVVETNNFESLGQLAIPASSGQLAGTAVEITADGSDIFVGAPGFNSDEYLSGIVYRFTSAAKTYGTITGAPVLAVTAGGSLSINGTNVSIIGTSLASVVAAITTSGIPGVTASITNGALTIASTHRGNNRLTVLPGTGAAYAELGFTAYAASQVIKHPGESTGEFFGTAIKSSRDENTLAIGSRNAPTHERISFDSYATQFDSGATAFGDKIVNSGAVYVFDLIENATETALTPSLFEFTQVLQAPAMDGIDFGAALDIENNSIFVGATRSQLEGVASGSAIEFSNPTGRPGWDLVRESAVKCDYASITKAFVYNKNTKTIMARLDIFDPAKGKLLGTVAQDLDYLTEYDPAVYNNGGENVNTALNWAQEQVGRTWWDLSQVRYVEYEQSTLAYRNANWGRLFPGSTVAVYEWVESDYTPAQYVAQGGEGVPKFADNSNYATMTYVDPVSGVIKSKNYFWVSGKTAVAANKHLSVYALQQAIIDPVSQGIPFVAAIADNAVSVFNVSSYLSGKSAVLHIDHSPIKDTNIIHTEYELVKENAANAPVPARIIKKLQDSLSGIDAIGNLVPDPKLGVAARYGIEVRPRQTMFVDRFVALKNFVEYINGVFAQHPIADSRDISKLLAGEEIPAANTDAYNAVYSSKAELDFVNQDDLYDGYRVLIPADTDNDGLWVIYQLDLATATWNLVRIQSYLTSLYTKTVNWYAAGYDASTKPTYVVANYTAVAGLALNNGDTVRVTDNGDGRFAVYKMVAGTLEKVASENGTVQILSTIYDLEAGNMGFDNDNFDTIRFDQSPVVETRAVFAAAVEDILIKDLEIEFNRAFFSLVNYLLTEQTAPDWIFKTSFISVVHNIRDLAQYPSYIKDNQTYYESYINEVKPYRTSIREYLPTQSALDSLYAGATDFDLPSYYDAASGTFRSPDGTDDGDAALLETGVYAAWSAAYKYSVVEIRVSAGGTGYTLIPTITIHGGGGTGATARAVLGLNGEIASVTVVTLGSGFTSTPTITVSGNGSGAVLVPVMRNQYSKYIATPSYNTVRNIETTLKFDRVLDSEDGTGELITSSRVIDWQPNTAYTASVGVVNGTSVLTGGKLVAHDGKVYLPVNANIDTEATFDSSLFQLVDAGDELITNSERVQAYYAPADGMMAKTLVQADSSDYLGVLVTGTKFTQNSSVIDSEISSTYLDTALGLRPEDINIDGGAYVDQFSSHAPEEMMPGRVYETLDVQVFTANTAGYTTNVFTIGSVTVHDGGYGYAAGNVQVTATGINGTVLRPVLDVNGSIVSVTILSGGQGLTEMADPVITVTGANSSPARITAKLTQSAYGLVGYRYFYDMNENLTYSRISAANTTVLVEPLALADEFMYVADASVLTAPDVERARPGRVFVNGELISFYTVDLVENKLGQLRRAVEGTGAAAEHAVDSKVTDAGSEQTIPGGADVHVTTWLNAAAGSAKFIKADTGERLADDLDNMITTTAASDNLSQLDTVKRPFADQNGKIVVETVLDANGNIIVDGAGNPTGAEITMFYAKNGIVTDGSGLMGSLTEQALFIKGVV